MGDESFLSETDVSEFDDNVFDTRILEEGVDQLVEIQEGGVLDRIRKKFWLDILFASSRIKYSPVQLNLKSKFVRDSTKLHATVDLRKVSLADDSPLSSPELAYKLPGSPRLRLEVSGLRDGISASSVYSEFNDINQYIKLSVQLLNFLVENRIIQILKSEDRDLAAQIKSIFLEKKMKPSDAFGGGIVADGNIRDFRLNIRRKEEYGFTDAERVDISGDHIFPLSMVLRCIANKGHLSQDERRYLAFTAPIGIWQEHDEDPQRLTHNDKDLANNSIKKIPPLFKMINTYSHRLDEMVREGETLKEKILALIGNFLAMEALDLRIVNGDIKQSAKIIFDALQNLIELAIDDWSTLEKLEKQEIIHHIMCGFTYGMQYRMLIVKQEEFDPTAPVLDNLDGPRELSNVEKLRAIINELVRITRVQTKDYNSQLVVYEGPLEEEEVLVDDDDYMSPGEGVVEMADVPDSDDEQFMLPIGLSTPERAGRGSQSAPSSVKSMRGESVATADIGAFVYNARLAAEVERDMYYASVRRRLFTEETELQSPVVHGAMEVVEKAQHRTTILSLSEQIQAFSLEPK